MAGHSQFKNIMHRKGRQDAAKAKIFTKLIREITTAARLGSPDPASNPRLRAATIAARENNMTRDTIDRAIKRGAGNEADVRSAYAVAENYGSEVLVERYLPGSDYRLLVVGERLVAASRREPPLVIGDGKHTVRQLVDKVNADIVKALATQDVKAKLAELGVEAVSSSPEDFGRFMASEAARWGKLVKEANLRVE